ncbi:hypothetical protein ACHQM5_006342 [Ranunculus cassubicifolius]
MNPWTDDNVSMLDALIANDMSISIGHHLHQPPPPLQLTSPLPKPYLNSNNQSQPSIKIIFNTVFKL